MRTFITAVVMLIFVFPWVAQAQTENRAEAKPMQSVTVNGVEYRLVPLGVVPVLPDDEPIRIDEICIEEKSSWLHLKKTCAWEKEVLPLQDGLLVLNEGVESSLTILSASAWSIAGAIFMLIAFVSIGRFDDSIVVAHMFVAAFGAATVFVDNPSYSHYGDSIRMAATCVALLTVATVLWKRQYLPRFLAVVYIILMALALFLP